MLRYSRTYSSVANRYANSSCMGIPDQPRLSAGASSPTSPTHRWFLREVGKFAGAADQGRSNRRTNEEQETEGYGQSSSSVQWSGNPELRREP